MFKLRRFFKRRTRPLAYSEGAYLAIDFQRNVARLNGTNYTAVSSVPNYSFSRALAAYHLNQNGDLVTFASGAARITDRGLLMEGAATNKTLQSQTFDNASWTKVNVTVTANQAYAPDGTLTADKIEATTTASTSLTQNVTSGATNAGSWSIYAKKGNSATAANQFRVRNQTAATTIIDGTLNYDTGVWTYLTGSSGVTVYPLANGWYRLTFEVNSGITSGNTVRGLYGFTSTGTAGDYCYLWGAQYEDTVYATSYIPTVAGTVTRPVDVLTIGSLSIAYPMASMVEFSRVADSGALSMMLHHDAGSTAESSYIGVDSSDLATAVQIAGSATQANPTVAGAISTRAVCRIGARFGTNSVHVGKGGSVGTEDTVATAPSTITTLRIGGGVSGVSPAYAEIRNLLVRNATMTDSDIKRLST